MMPQPAQRGGSAKSSAQRTALPKDATTIAVLSLMAAQRTSASVPELFDMKLRALRRDRAQRSGAELFLHERAFADCIDRLNSLRHAFDRALLIGCPDPRWPSRLRDVAPAVDVLDPGQAFAKAAGGQAVVEDAWEPPHAAYDLVLAIGSLDTVNDLPLALRILRHAMRPQALLIGALSGGDTVPMLRRAMLAADVLTGAAAPHVHPRIEPAALAPLLTSAGFVDAVVDVDRVQASYSTLDRLVADLRAMAATNILIGRPRFLDRRAYAAAAKTFAGMGDGERTVETFEILHFAAWTPVNS